MYAVHSVTSAWKKPVKQVLGFALDVVGISDRRVDALLTAKPTWLVATYHRVTPRPGEGIFDAQMCVPQATFRSQLTYLKSRFEIMQAGEVVRRARAGQSLPARIASITFDDGYLDNLEVAKPVLDELGLPWSMYVITGGLEQGEGFWWDRALRAFREWPGDTIDLRELGLSQFAEPVKRSQSTADAVANMLVGRLWSLPHPDVLRVLALLESTAPPPRSGPRMRVTPEEVAKLRQSGVEIGAHTVSHPNLALLAPAQVEGELRTSRQRLQEICGAPVNGFAYPGGRLTEDTEKIVAQSGFDYALSTRADLNRVNFDYFKLNRISMPTLSLADFKRALVSVVGRAQQVKT